MTDRILDLSPDWLQSGVERGWIGSYETGALRFLTREFGPLPDQLTAAVLFALLFVKAGHTRLPLEMHPGQWISHLDLDSDSIDPDSIPEPDLNTLAGHPAVGAADEVTPFVIEESSLYIRRNLQRERSVSRRLLEMAGAVMSDFDAHKIQPVLDRLFDSSQRESHSGEPDWQRVAAALSLRRQLLIISGGPGTGKTTTVSRIIRMLEAVLERPLHIALTAPTGKAAARMNQALQSSLTAEVPGAEERLQIGEARTLHRLLREVEESGILPPGEHQTFIYDLIILDEASMVDLELMNRLLDHLDHQTRLILLGDKDQLASVEAGAVLSDICRKSSNYFRHETAAYLSEAGIEGEIDLNRDSSDLEESTVYLTRSYRFDGTGGISRLAAAVNGQQAEEAVDLLDQIQSGIGFSRFDYSREDLTSLFHSAAGVLKSAEGLDGEELVNHWNQTIWLGVLRRGPLGTDSLNREIEQYLLKNRLIRPAEGWYHGRPVMVTRNDYNLRVFNGDLGVCSWREESGMWVLFPDMKGGIREIPVHRLRDFEPAYLLTVHKSQGSEFDRVNLLLPPHDTPVLTKELIYTALTRARHHFHLHGRIELFEEAIKRKTDRFTGLQSRLFPTG